MDKFIDSILGLQKKERKSKIKADGTRQIRHSLICFHNIDWDISDWFKF